MARPNGAVRFIFYVPGVRYGRASTVASQSLSADTAAQAGFHGSVFMASITYHLIPFPQEFAVWIFQSLTHVSWIVWVEKNKKGIVFAALVSMH